LAQFADARAGIIAGAGVALCGAVYLLLSPARGVPTAGAPAPGPPPGALAAHSWGMLSDRRPRAPLTLKQERIGSKPRGASWWNRDPTHRRCTCTGRVPVGSTVAAGHPATRGSRSCRITP